MHPTFDPLAELAAYNLRWDQPGNESAKSLPLGNGTVGANVWATSEGEIIAYLSRSDAWDSFGRLLKVCRFRLRVIGAAALDDGYEEILNLPDATLHIRLPSGLTARIWIEAAEPVLHIEIQRPKGEAIDLLLDRWRPPGMPLMQEDWHKTDLTWCPDPQDDGDHFPEALPSTLFVYRQNCSKTVWQASLRQQGAGDISDKHEDPLAERVFGAAFHCAEGEVLAPDHLRIGAGTRTIHLRALVPAPARVDPGAWRVEASAALERHGRIGSDVRVAAHLASWHKAWRRSWIFITGEGDEPISVTRAYVLQRYLNLCACGGPQPIKFNGSLFTADFRQPERPSHADFRQWGGAYWFQNTRLAYWSMPACGDLDGMLPLFATYIAALPLREELARRHFGHEGAFFPETMYFWGAYLMSDYARNRETTPAGISGNPYTRYYWCAGLELAALLYAYLDHGGTDKAAASALLPLLRAHARFYLGHFPRDPAGRLIIEPAQALEQHHDVRNPFPDIAAWLYLLDRIEGMSAELSSDDQDLFAEMRSALPPLPLLYEAEVPRFALAEIVRDPPQNTENPELYSIFPYPLHGIGRPHLEMAQRSFLQRVHKGCGGWRQDPIQAARLGYGELAAEMLVSMAKGQARGTRFPAFWGPNFDWIPDQDHGNVLMTALQQMLLQNTPDGLRVFSAWPDRWKVNFRLHAPGGKIVEGHPENGRYTVQTRPAPPRRPAPPSRSI